MTLSVGALAPPHPRWGESSPQQWGVGDAAIDSILDSRQDGSFRSLFGFCERVDLRQINRRMLEALVCAGALDSLEGHRDIVFESCFSPDGERIATASADGMVCIWDTGTRRLIDTEHRAR